MAVIVIHKNEQIEPALRRFQRQVLKEGIIQEVIARRWFVSKSEIIRKKKMDLNRMRKRRKRRRKKKPPVVVSLKRKII